MARIGYARVSTTDHDLAIQLEALKAAGCDPIRAEKASGASTTGQTELSIVLDFIGKGDTLVVTRIDRLARSIGDPQDIVRPKRPSIARPDHHHCRPLHVQRRGRGRGRGRVGSSLGLRWTVSSRRISR